MGRYTLRGSAQLDARIDADLARIAGAVAPFARAGVLIGGYGRGEGTPLVLPDGSQAPFNDYDLVVLVDRPARTVRAALRAVAERLSGELGLPADLCPYRLSRLGQCEFSLLNCEMRHGHKVVWGDARVLDALPAFPLGALPLSEGARLLLNRGKLLLDMQERLARPAPLDAEERGRFAKFVHKVLLAFGDCALLAEGRYDLSYRTKRDRIPSIGDIPGRDFVVDGFLRAVEQKEWCELRALEAFDAEREFGVVREVFLRFFPWYRSLCPRRECPAPKAVALNLAWTRRLAATHPRLLLYDALPELLRGGRPMPLDRFYALQRRFS